MSKNYNPMRKNWIWGLSLLLIGGMASCKSSQSAYKAAYEKAQEKKIEEPVTTGTTPVVTTPSTTTTTTTTTTTNTAPIREQSEKINAVDGNVSDSMHRAFASVCVPTAILPYWLRMHKVCIVS